MNCPRFANVPKITPLTKHRFGQIFPYPWYTKGTMIGLKLNDFLKFHITRCLKLAWINSITKHLKAHASHTCVFVNICVYSNVSTPSLVLMPFSYKCNLKKTHIHTPMIETITYIISYNNLEKIECKFFSPSVSL